MKLLRWLMKQPLILAVLFVLYIYVCSQLYQSIRLFHSLHG